MRESLALSSSPTGSRLTASVELLEKTVSASAGALITSLVVTPLDVVKVRMQAQGFLLPSSASYVFCTRFHDHVEPCSCRTLYLFEKPVLSPRLPITGTFDGVLKITRNEGLAGLWRGLSPTLLMSIPGTVVYYVGYEALRESIKSLLPNMSPTMKDIGVPLLAGSSARIAAVSLISPIELLKTRMQHRGTHGGILAVSRDLRDAVRSQGFGVLYRGLVPTLWRDVPFSAIYWACYERFKVFYGRSIPIRSASDQFFLSFISGATSGVIAAALTTPFDVAKTRKQVSIGNTASALHGKSFACHLMEIWKAEGVAGLTRGIVPRIGKVAPSCAIMVGSYEFGKSYLRNRNTIA